MGLTWMEVLYLSSEKEIWKSLVEMKAFLCMYSYQNFFLFLIKTIGIILHRDGTSLHVEILGSTSVMTSDTHTLQVDHF